MTQEVDRFAREFEELFNRGDPATMASFYAEDAMVMAPESELVEGRSAIERFWRAACEAAQRIDIRRTINVRHVESSGNLGYVVSTVTLEIPAPEGHATIITFNDVTVWKAADGGWHTAFEAPQAGVWLVPFGSNVSGQISGEYVRFGQDTTADSESGFVRDRRGRFTVFDVPGARGTEAVKINNRGQVASSYSDNTPIVNDPAAKVHGYLWERGRMVTIDVPGAVNTVPFGINGRGQIAGTTATNRMLEGAHGFLLAKGVKGAFTPVDVPGAPRTQVGDIDDLGRIVGRYENPAATPAQQHAGAQAMSMMAGVMAGG